MNEITTIIFSKNRACQLELLLRSLNMPVSVIYKATDGFEKGYEKLIKMYPKTNFIKEDNFKKQVIENIGEYTMFLCDDDIMIEHFDENCPEFIEFKNNPNILCLSLRLAPYYKNAPVFINNTWEWRKKTKDWGYPMSVTSHIFRKEDILPVMENGTFTNPNNLEVLLRRNAPDRPLMLCFDKPKTINNLANKVQDKCLNPNVYGVPIEYLEENFILGKVLSLKDIKEKAKNANCCFLSTDFKWENNWLSLHKKNITSQRGEDGIIEKIFEVIDISQGWCVDVGAFGKNLSNTYSLIKKGWGGFLFEMDEDKILNLKKEYKGNNNVFCVCKEVCPKGEDSLDSLLRTAEISPDFDFLTIDVGGNDYHIWDNIDNYEPKVVVIEFNPTFGYDDYLQPIDGEGGASLSKIIELGKTKGYELIATTEINAFFVKKDLFDKFDISNNSIEELFVKNKETYGRKTRKYYETI